GHASQESADMCKPRGAAGLPSAPSGLTERENPAQRLDDDPESEHDERWPADDPDEEPEQEPHVDARERKQEEIRPEDAGDGAARADHRSGGSRMHRHLR